MTTILFGIKDTKSNLSFTKAKVFPNQLFLLSNPLLNDEIMIKKSCINGNLYELLNISSEKKHRIFSNEDKKQSKKLKLTASTSASTFTSIKSFDKKLGKNIRKHEKNIKSKDLGYIIPLNIDDNIKDLKKSRNISNYYKICNNNNNFIYQVINNELYIIVSILKNFFNTNHKQELLDNLSKNLNCIKKNFKNEIEELFNKENKRHTYTLYGGCNTMQGHPNYVIPTKDEKYCHIAEFIQNYLTNESCKFEDLKSKKDLYDNFRNSIPLNQMVDIKKCHFNEILESKNRFKFYLYLKEQLFPLIIKLESLVAKLIQCSFPELYSLFNIDIPNIKINLSFFKSFAINFGLQEETNSDLIRQGATDPHKDQNDCLYAFCAVVVFGDFEGGDLVLSEIGLVIEIKCGYIILLRSSLLEEHFNTKVLKGKRDSIVFYLRKFIYNEI